MIALHILSGKQAGGEIIVRHFPFLIGREAGANLQLDDAGVWERHLQIDFDPTNGFTFAAGGEALAVWNGESAAAGQFRNGDVLELGSVRLRFWLARSEQKSLRWRESLTWTALLALFAVQALLIRLLHH